MRFDLTILSLRAWDSITRERHTADRIRHILVRIHHHDECGIGVARMLNGEGEPLPEHIQLATQGLKDMHPLDMQAEQPMVPGHSSLSLAIDIGLHDLRGHMLSRPLREVLHIPPATTDITAVTVSDDGGNALQMQIEHVAHWPLLKLKLNANSDPSTITQVRQRYNGRLWVDCNGTPTEEAAMAIARHAADAGIELLEQPLPPGQFDALRRLRQQVTIPIVADEDCRHAADVASLRGLADVVNIKLAKCGSIGAAMQAISVARQHGMCVMLGCKTESVAGVCAIAQLAGLADYLDFDGHLFLDDDPFTGLSVDRGHLTFPTGTGVGINDIAPPQPLSTRNSGENLHEQTTLRNH